MKEQPGHQGSNEEKTVRWEKRREDREDPKREKRSKISRGMRKMNEGGREPHCGLNMAATCWETRKISEVGWGGGPPRAKPGFSDLSGLSGLRALLGR